MAKFIKVTVSYTDKFTREKHSTAKLVRSDDIKEVVEDHTVDNQSLIVFHSVLNRNDLFVDETIDEIKRQLNDEDRETSSDS